MRNRTEHYNDGDSGDNSDWSSDGEDAQLKKLHSRMCGMDQPTNSDIVPRPGASSGYWLCCLLPLALGVSHWNTLRDSDAQCVNVTEHYSWIVLTSVAICIQNISFFIYLKLQAKLYKWLIVFVPFLCGSYIFKLTLDMTWWLAFLWTLCIDVVYQRCYIQVMRNLPKSFTYGEASILTQGLVLFVLHTMLAGYSLVSGQSLETLGDLDTLSRIMTFALFWLLIVCVAMLSCKLLRKPFIFYPIIMVFIAASTIAPITQPLPVIALFEFIFRDKLRLYIILFYILLVGLTVAVVCWQLRNHKHATTSIRKLFHLLLVLVFIPGILYECEFLYIASGVALALIALFDLLRILQMPPLAEVLQQAFNSFADEKDAGFIAFTPLCLLIGCSLPLWMTPCTCQANKDGLNPRLLALLSGVLTIGFGDTAASVIGSKYGRTKWKNSSRTIEGTVAFIFYVILPIVIFHLMEFLQLSPIQWLIVALATVVSALIEAHTDQIDNLVLPLVFYIVINLC